MGILDDIENAIGNTNPIKQKVYDDIKANGGKCNCKSTWCEKCGVKMMGTR